MIEMTEYAKRRQALMRMMGKDSLMILPAGEEILRNGDSTYPFRQQSDFYYLTGFDEPEAMMVLLPDQKEPFLLFNRVRDRSREIWDGPRAGQEGACRDYLADQAYPISAFEAMLPDLLASKTTIYCPIGKNAYLDQLIVRALNTLRAKVRQGVSTPNTFIDVLPFIHQLRLLKSSAEIAILQQAVDITKAGHIRAMSICRPGLYEYALEAALLNEFVRHGAREPAYSSIVGSGANSCVLHYRANNKQIVDGDLVLIDAGAEYQNYAADITRTFPANGRFTGEQRAIYELVLASQLAAIATIKPGASWLAAQQAIVTVLTQGLIDLKILKGSFDELLEKQAYLAFYMHRSGHWLGLDVHDAGAYQKDGSWRLLEPGMVFTVEPGLYIAADVPGVDPRWHHIGVRIEDNVVVTGEGCDVLSQAIPKAVVDIEATMADARA